MPFALHPACQRLRQTHGRSADFRRTLLDLAFASGAAVSEQAVALEHGDGLVVRLQSGDPDASRHFVVVDVDPPGRGGTWPPTLTALGGPVVAQTWAILLHALLSQPQPWALMYVRGPALGVAAYVGDLTADSPRIQVAPVPETPGPTVAMDVVSVSLQRAENVWRLPACDWTGRVEAPDLGILHHWLARQTGAWTLHDVHQPAGHPVQAALRLASAPNPPTSGEPDPAVIWLLGTPPQSLGFPVNDALEAWPRAILPQALASRSLGDGLWLAGVAAADDVAAISEWPETCGGLSATWDDAQLTRVPAEVERLAVVAAEVGPIPAGPGRAAWLVPGGGEVEQALRGIGARLRRVG